MRDQRAVDVDLDARRSQRGAAEVQRRIAHEVWIEIEVSLHGHAADERRSAEEIGDHARIARGPSAQSLTFVDAVAAQQANEVTGGRTRNAVQKQIAGDADAVLREERRIMARLIGDRVVEKAALVF